jgi:UDP-glucose 4-epimerase
MRVIITGGAGFIGSRLSKYLLDTIQNPSLEIISIDDLSGGFIENVPNDSRLIFLKADFTNKQDQLLIEQEIQKKDKLDYIYHLGCLAWEGLSAFNRQLTYNINTIGSAFLINCGIKYNIKRFIFTSSMAVYGHGNNTPPFDEDLIPCPIDPYGIAKYCVEMDLKVAYDQHNLEYVIIRPHNVIGKSQNIYDPYRNVLGIWMYQALTNQPFTIYGDGEQTRAFSVIDDVLPCLHLATVKPEVKNQIVNVGGIKEISLNKAAELVSKITNNKNGVIYLEPRHEVKHAWSSYKKSVDLLDYRETITLKDGLIEMWNWAKTLSLRERKYFTEYELDKGIYSYWKQNYDAKINEKI